MRRDKCGGCGSGDLRQFLDLGETPLAGDFPVSVAAAAERQRWPLGAAVCGSCWLVQLTEVVPDDVLWSGDYGFYTGASPSSVDYFRQYATDLITHSQVRPGLIAGGLVVEVACNDGTLLQHFNGSTLGVEPAKGPAEAARAKGLDVVEQSFGRATAQGIVDAYGRASLVVANNVLAHVADLDDFVGGLALLLADDGVLVVEVQYLADLLLGNGFDLLYHEHRSFFDVESLSRVMWRHGLGIRSGRRTPAQGGSIRVTLGRGESPSHDWQIAAMKSERPLWSSLPAYESMQGRAELVRERLRSLVQSEREAGRTVVGYGAPAKATTLLHWCGLTSSDDVAHVLDLTPAKFGRYMPGTDIAILNEDDDVSDCSRTTRLLLSHNYAGDIITREQIYREEGGRWIVPLPVPVVI